MLGSVETKPESGVGAHDLHVTALNKNQAGVAVHRPSRHVFVIMTMQCPKRDVLMEVDAELEPHALDRPEEECHGDV